MRLGIRFGPFYASGPVGRSKKLSRAGRRAEIKADDARAVRLGQECSERVDAHLAKYGLTPENNYGNGPDERTD